KKNRKSLELAIGRIAVTAESSVEPVFGAAGGGGGPGPFSLPPCFAKTKRPINPAIKNKPMSSFWNTTVTIQAIAANSHASGSTRSVLRHKYQHDLKQSANTT